MLVNGVITVGEAEFSEECDTNSVTLQSVWCSLIILTHIVHLV